MIYMGDVRSSFLSETDLSTTWLKLCSLMVRLYGSLRTYAKSSEHLGTVCSIEITVLQTALLL
jgi:hypothetical protein